MSTANQVKAMVIDAATVAYQESSTVYFFGKENGVKYESNAKGLEDVHEASGENVLGTIEARTDIEFDDKDHAESQAELDYDNGRFDEIEATILDYIHSN